MQLTVDREWQINEAVTELDRLEIGPEGTLSAPEGKCVLMTVNGVFTDPGPGIYEGRIVLTVADAVPKVGSWENNYRSAVFYDGTPIPEKSAAGAFSGLLSEGKMEGGCIEVSGHLLNGLTMTDGALKVSGTRFVHNGNGGDDFELWGTAVGICGTSSAVLDSVEIRTKGVVTTAVAAGGDSKVVVMNSVIRSEGTDNTGWYAKHPHLSETPWVLGIRGTLRATNVLDCANVTYYNCDCTSNGWGVLSTDGTKDATHNIINTTARIPEGSGFSSGYGAYILGGVTSTFLGAEIEVPDFCFAVGGNNHPITVGASSRENLEACGERLQPLKDALGGSFDPVEERNSVISSARFVGMWHHQSSEPFVALPGTVLRAGDTAFLIKSGEMKVNGPEIVCDGCLVEAPRIVHLMETDDAGMGVRTHDKCWAPCIELYPNTPDRQEGYDPTVCAETDAHVTLKNMTVTGDCLNTRTTSGQGLLVDLEGTSLTGVVSSGRGTHRRFSYGIVKNEDGSRTCTDAEGRKYLTEKLDDLLFGKMPVTSYVPKTDETGAFVYDPNDDAIYPIDGYGIYYTDPQYVADLDVVPAPAVNNGVLLRLREGSVWTVAGTSFLTRLEIGEGCAAAAPEGKSLRFLVNGIDTIPTPGVYTGELRLIVE